MINSNVTTITLDGAETAVEFERDYPYYQITNRGGADIYVSMSPGIVPEAEGVYTVPAGGSEIIGEGYAFPAFYILGTGKAYIRGKRDAMSASFNRTAKGGGDSGNGNSDVIFGTAYTGGNLMPQTLVKIDEYTTGNDVIKKIAENWGMPFEDDADNDNAGRIWLNREENIFLLCESVKNQYNLFQTSIKLCHGSVVSNELWTYAGINSPPNASYLYIDRNPGGTALYIRAWHTTGSYALIIAKDKSGDWSCLTYQKMVTQNGVFDINATNAIRNANLLYTAFAMPNAVNGSLFDGIYMMCTSPDYVGTAYVANFDVNGKPFRGVNLQTGTSTNNKIPNYAFEARQTKEV